MFWKRQIPIAIVALVGTLTLFGWFTDQPTIKAFVDDDATQWYDILASFAIFLGALNLLKLQSQKIIKRKKGWQYSIFVILGFLFSFSAGFIIYANYTVNVNTVGNSPDEVAALLSETTGNSLEESLLLVNAITESGPEEIDNKFWRKKNATLLAERLNSNGADATVMPIEWGAHLNSEGSLFYWMFMNFFKPLQASMFALLAFLVASASYRAFRIRNFEATLLLVSGIIIMLGRVPIGSKISSWFILYLVVMLIGVMVNTWQKNRLLTFGTVGLGVLVVTIAGFMMGWPIDRPAFAFLPELQEWVYMVPNIAGARAIMIGIGLGIFATSIRYILGIEKSYIGE